MRGRAAAAASLLAIVLAGAVYASSLAGDFVYDDHRFVERNPAVEGGAELADYFLDPGTQTGDGSHEGIWRPLRTLSFRAVRLLGPGAGLQRGMNLAIHLVNGILAWALLRRLLGAGRFLSPLLGALVFVLHPVATESVAWVSGRGDLLAATGVLASALLFLRGGAIAVGAALSTFALGLLSKESAAVLPFLLLALSAVEGGGREIRRRFPAWAPFFVLLGLWVVARTIVLDGSFAQGTGRGLDRGIAGASTFTEWLYYLRIALLPAGLTFEFQLPRAPDAPLLAVAGLLVFAGLVWLAWSRRRTDPVLTLSILWFAIVLLPVTVGQLVFPLKILVANRFAYLALFAMAVLLGRVAGSGRQLAALVGVVVLAFVPLSAARADVWRTDESLWNDVVRHDPRSAVGLYGAGVVAARRGEYERATGLLLRSAAEDPRHPAVAALLGEVTERLAAVASGPDERRLLHSRAFSAYHAAVRSWQGGVREDFRLYRPTLASAAELALAVGRVDLAMDHVKHLLSDDGPLPPPGEAREQFLRRLYRLAAAHEQGGEAELAAGLRALGEALSPGGIR